MFGRLIFNVFFSLLFSSTVTCFAHNGKQEVTVALIDTFSPEFYIYTYSPTIDHLIQALPEFKFNLVEIDPEDIEAGIKKYKPAFMVSSASSYVSMMDSNGAHQVATREPKSSPDVAHTVASTIIVPADSDIHHLSEAKGKVVAISSKNSFAGWLIAKAELTALGDPEYFFSKILETQHVFPDVATLVRAGMADVGVLETCELESLIASGSVTSKEFRILNESKSHLGCLKSTELFPDAVFSSLPGVPSSVSRKVAVALLTMPNEKLNFQWTVANDFVPTYNLLKKLKIGPFTPVNIWSFEAFITHYSYQITFVLALLLLIIFHSFYINFLVKKRTAQLRNALSDMERFHQEALTNKKKLDSIERMSIVSQLSSMFAHEIKQPITNISYYAGSLKMFFKQQEWARQAGAPVELLDAINAEVNRSTRIIDKLRAYAKTRHSTAELCNLKQIIEKAVHLHPCTFLKNTVHIECEIWADRFEVEFIIANLIKNAEEAAVFSKRPRVSVSVEDTGHQWKLNVVNNGKDLSESEVQNLGLIGNTTKPDGLGWALSISCAMAESNGGHLEFVRNKGGGLIVRLLLPKYRGEENEQKRTEGKVS